MNIINLVTRHLKVAGTLLPTHCEYHYKGRARHTTQYRAMAEIFRTKISLLYSKLLLTSGIYL